MHSLLPSSSTCTILFFFLLRPLYNPPSQNLTGEESMHSLLITSTLCLLLLLLLCLHSTIRPALSKPDRRNQKFFTDCPTTSCGSLHIRFPFRLQSSKASCGVKGLELTCHDNQTLLLYLPSAPSSPFRVTDIDYPNGQLAIYIGGPESESESCPPGNFSSLSYLATSMYTPETFSISLISCPNKLIPTDTDIEYWMAGPISCLSGSGRYVYAVDVQAWMSVIPSNCVVVKTGGDIPYPLYPRSISFSLTKSFDYFVRKKEVYLLWDNYSDKFGCRKCEEAGRFCGFDEDNNHTICQHNSHPGRLLKTITITGASIGGLLILLVLLIFLYISRISTKEKEIRLKVERFLATYKSTNPTRYPYSEIKKITRHFRQKLGQGGFGSVYKGELPNGIPVAIKMLEKSKGEGQEFINEVATIGRIHHVNVVRLLGFCSEGTRHALVYEFMPNESLEKFIYLKTSKRHGQPFSMEKVQDIAIGIARGIEYLHQGCDQRILHFDIKPHNILLDHNFNPKISDFGLAKLCSRDDSFVTMTAARGTMGYIAPEIYSRNFGAVSYKSDVFSFGMLLLEMVTGKKNVDPTVGNQSDAYFPEWLYERLVNGEDLECATVEKEENIVNKLVIVAFWCIQWSPTDRPSMTRVVQLLLGNWESLQIPPKPFVSSSDQDNGISVNREL